MSLAPGLGGDDSTHGAPPLGGAEGGVPGQRGGGPADDPQTHPRITSELDWRARALAAEERIKDLQSQVEAAAEALVQEQARAHAAVRQASIERALAAAGAVDIESAALVLERSLPPASITAAPESPQGGQPNDQPDSQPNGHPAALPALQHDMDADIQAAVADLKQRKPALFLPTRSPPPSSPAYSAMSASPDAPDPARLLADQARQSGDRRLLLRYLRARRPA